LSIEGATFHEYSRFYEKVDSDKLLLDMPLDKQSFSCEKLNSWIDEVSVLNIKNILGYTGCERCAGNEVTNSSCVSCGKHFSRVYFVSAEVQLQSLVGNGIYSARFYGEYFTEHCFGKNTFHLALPHLRPEVKSRFSQGIAKMRIIGFVASKSIEEKDKEDEIHCIFLPRHNLNIAYFNIIESNLPDIRRNYDNSHSSLLKLKCPLDKDDSIKDFNYSDEDLVD
jgi:hypothetical protein